jgi:hypothetical protein
MLRHSPPLGSRVRDIYGGHLKMGATRKDVCRLHNSRSGVFTGQGSQSLRSQTRLLCA